MLTALIVCAIASLLLVPAIAHAQAQQPVLDGIANQYRDASRLWRPRLVPIAQQLFMLLASIEFAVSGLVWALRHDRLDDIARRFPLALDLGCRDGVLAKMLRGRGGIRYSEV